MACKNPIPVWVTRSKAIDKFLYLWKKFVKSSIALMNRNLISAWPMKKFCKLFFFAKLCWKSAHTSKNLLNPLVNSYRNTISEWAVVFRYDPWANLWGVFNPGDEEISIPEKWPIRKSYIEKHDMVLTNMALTNIS